MSVDYHTQNGLNAYKQYVAIRQHFTSDYDYFKYNGVTNASMSSYKKRKDAIFFEKLCKHPDFVNFVAFNMAVYDDVYPKSLATLGKYQLHYEKWKREIESIHYTIRSFLKERDFTSWGDIARYCRVPEDGSHPLILKDYLAGKIDLVIFSAFDRQFCLVQTYDKYIKEPLVWPRISNKIKKIKFFLQFEPLVVAKVMRELISETFTKVQPLNLHSTL